MKKKKKNEGRNKLRKIREKKKKNGRKKGGRGEQEE